MNCAFCENKENLTEHHLIPRCRHKRYIKKYTRKELNKTIILCNKCHNQLHDFFTETELAKEYNTLDLLLKSDSVQKWIGWIRKRSS